MATKYKILNTTNDVASTRTLLHEAIPLSGNILSGTYDVAASTSELNIKHYAHGMFQSVYDYPFLSSSANHILDLTVGYSNESALSGGASTQNAKKINIYNEVAQVLNGYDITGAIQPFTNNGDTNGTRMNEVFFVNFARLLTKDEIKKETFSMTFLTGGSPAELTDTYTISDYTAGTSYRSDSPAGEYGILYSGSAAATDSGVGLCFYQAGVAVITASIFSNISGSSPAIQHCTFGTQDSNVASVNTSLKNDAITGSCNGLRNRIQNISCNNTTELNSTVYFCRVNHKDYNYSSNPTYLTASKIRTRDTDKAVGATYITTVGLYSADNQLLAVAKLSEPLKKTPTNELTLRVRLDY